jgi:hypothetical protein
MMYWGNGDWNWAAWIAMTASMVVFWGFIAWVVVTLVRRPEDGSPTPEDILADRFAAARSTTTSTTAAGTLCDCPV